MATNVLFRYPQDPRNTSPSTLQRYFEYGRSTEGKLARMTRPTDEASAPIIMAGWLEGPLNPLPVHLYQGTASKPVVTFYGMSHAGMLAGALAGLDPTRSVRVVIAPGGTATWSYAAYMADRQRVRSDVVVLAVMTSTIPLLATTAGNTMYFDGAYPYTFPRYYLRNGALLRVNPPFSSVEEYRRYFYDPHLWDSYLRWLRDNDKYYNPFLFKRTPLDGSSLIRLLRRSYALATCAAKQASMYDDERGFNPASEEVLVLERLVADFARQARLDGSIPMVYIVNNLNMKDHAFRALQPVLSRHSVPYLSSHQFVPPNEPRNYLPDSHFTPAMDTLLAGEMKILVHAEMEKRSHSGAPLDHGAQSR